jgi:NhaP-type Na+/H+ or K+/H+ antiporter
MTDFILQNQLAFYYSLIGAAFMGLTFQPALGKKLFYNVPIIYISVGALGALIGLPVINPLSSEAELKIIEHASELIVIISLVGAGLSIDLKAGWRTWQPTWRLLIFAMPLTILSIVFLGNYVLGLGIAAAVLLGASIAPTDPVLARSVSVGAPNSDQKGAQTALTSEAGLNDGLAFPFIWLAIALSAANIDSFSFLDWLSYKFLFKVGMGVAIGLITGWAITKLLFSRIGDAANDRSNPLLVVLAATFLSYGIAEFAHGYGFLSVFIAARAGRALTKGSKAEPYENKAHHAADQIESVLLALILLWFGTFIGGTLWTYWTWMDLSIALAIILLIRPLAAWLSLFGLGIERPERVKIAFFGIRGMGSIYYMAFALSHAEFDDPARLWSILSLTILVSAIIHGSLSDRWMEDSS